MNELLTSLPLVILTGAGASKWLGKATTYDIYDSPEFEERCGTAPFNVLREVRDLLLQAPNVDAPDLELLLDYMLDTMTKFDALRLNPHFVRVMAQGESIRNEYAEAYEQALDFMVDYYGNVDGKMAAELYGPFFDGVVTMLGSHVLPLFTLNYDEAVESAVDELADYALVDGFRTGYRPVWSPDSFDDLEQMGFADATVAVALFKLHGSVSWTRSARSGRIERTVSLPRRRPGRDHVILYPTRLAKPMQHDPFATGYAYLRAALARARLAVFIGTSFRDAELLEMIREVSNHRKPFRLMAVGPKVNQRDIMSRTGFHPGFVDAVRLSFEPGDIPKLLGHIQTELSRV